MKQLKWILVTLLVLEEARLAHGMLTGGWMILVAALIVLLTWLPAMRFVENNDWLSNKFELNEKKPHQGGNPDEAK